MWAGWSAGRVVQGRESALIHLLTFAVKKSDPFARIFQFPLPRTYHILYLWIPCPENRNIGRYHNVPARRYTASVEKEIHCLIKTITLQLNCCF